MLIREFFAAVFSSKNPAEKPPASHRNQYSGLYVLYPAPPGFVSESAADARTSNGKPHRAVVPPRRRPYGISPKTLWIGPDAAKGYLKDDLNVLFKRYITKADLEELKLDTSPPPSDKPFTSTSNASPGHS